jgi:hypothetical protein
MEILRRSTVPKVTKHENMCFLVGSSLVQCWLCNMGVPSSVYCTNSRISCTFSHRFLFFKQDTIGLNKIRWVLNKIRWVLNKIRWVF